MTFHHLGVAVKSMDAAIPVYQRLFGYELFSGPLDDSIQRVSVCFLRCPSQPGIVLELVAPLKDDTPVTRLLEKGGGPYHTCYEVANLEEALAAMTSQECLVVSQPVPAAAFNQRRIAWLLTPTRQLVELLERGAGQ